MQVIVLKKEKKEAGDQICHLGLIPAQRGGQGERARACCWAGAPGPGLVSGAAQRPGSGMGGAVHSRSWLTAGAGGPSARSWWTRTTLSLLPLRFAVRREQPGGSPPLSSPVSLSHGADSQRGAPTVSRGFLPLPSPRISSLLL